MMFQGAVIRKYSCRAPTWTRSRARNMQSLGSYVPGRPPEHTGCSRLDAGPADLYHHARQHAPRQHVLAGRHAHQLDHRRRPGPELPRQRNHSGDDIGIRRLFHPRPNVTVYAQAEIFNVINANTVLTESETLGTSVGPYLPGAVGGQPSALTNPRMLRLSLQFKF